jgi:hypothetical protein
MWPFHEGKNLTVEESAEIQARKICYMGWFLLFAWLAMIIYITRVSFWFKRGD